MDLREKTFRLIDDLKLTCQSYGLGNDGNEYKIITQMFLYKFLVSNIPVYTYEYTLMDHASYCNLSYSSIFYELVVER